jgi:predicted signal transduction protein with EAL and GGDEF domain
LIAFAREIDIAIIAEGVETAAELNVLAALGVAQVQGYYLARPMPLSAIAPCLTLAPEWGSGEVYKDSEDDFEKATALPSAGDQRSR